jgi:hypothetical protein
MAKEKKPQQSNQVHRWLELQMFAQHLHHKYVLLQRSNQ